MRKLPIVYQLSLRLQAASNVVRVLLMLSFVAAISERVFRIQMKVRVSAAEQAAYADADRQTGSTLTPIIRQRKWSLG